MIKLTKQIDGESVELNLISLKGKTCITAEDYDGIKEKHGTTKKALKDAGIEVLSE